MTEWESKLSFFVNGSQRHLSSLDPRMTVLEYLRQREGFKGAKLVCGQGGCGACSVVITKFNSVTKSFDHYSANACLLPVAALADCNVTTTEGIGSTKAGFHAVQERIAKYGGSQCGYCTPGMVMAMYGLLQSKDGKPTARDVDDLFDGNLCRCTGYRPILMACHTFAVDCKDSCTDVDIEDIGKSVKAYDHNCDSKPPGTLVESPIKPLHFQNGGVHWYRPVTLEQLFSVRKEHKDHRVRYVVGNTSKGVYGLDNQVQVYIDTTAISSFNKVTETESHVVVGAAVTLTKLIDALNQRKEKSSSFEPAARHIRRIANTHVRNAASWIGNLQIARVKNFTSDLATVTLGLGCEVSLQYDSGESKTLTIDQFLQLSGDDFVVTELRVPFAKKNQVFDSYRASLRTIMSKPVVNSAYNVTLDGDKIVQATVVYGAVDKHAKRATKTEEALVGKQINHETFSNALKVLSSEIVPQHMDIYKTIEYPQGKEEYRQIVVGNFFYKFFLHLNNVIGKSSKLLEVANIPYQRPITTGKREYEKDKPGRMPMPKLDATQQASGESKYTADIDVPPRTLYGAFVLSTQAGVKLDKIDASEALKMPGVVDFIHAKDVKGNIDIGFLPKEEVLFISEGEGVPCVGHLLGVVVAEKLFQAEAAVPHVKVTYGEEYDGKPIYSIDDGIARGSFLAAGKHEVNQGNVEEAFAAQGVTILEGEFKTGGQHPFYLERASALAIPGEANHMTIYTPSQSGTYYQQKVASTLGVSQHQVTLSVRRIGGGFGGKLTRTLPVTVATAVSSQKTGRPVRVETSIKEDLTLTAGRHDFKASYKVAFDKNGKITALDLKAYGNTGYSHDFSVVIFLEFNEAIDDVYFIPNLRVLSQGVKTNLPTRTAVRTFGKSQAKYVIETILERIALAVGKAPEEVREINMYNKLNCITPFGVHLEQFNVPTLFQKLKTQGNYDERKKLIEQYNKDHKWKKRGLSAVGLKFGLHQGYMSGSHVNLTYYADGTITMFHGSVEKGTGTDTKAAQVVSMILGCDINKIRIAPFTTDVIGQAAFNGGSVSSEAICEAARKASIVIKDRLSSLKLEMWKNSKEGKEPTWDELAAAACGKHYVQSASENFVPLGEADREILGAPWQKNWSNYFVYSVAMTEVELDVLSGEVEIVRSDVIYDAGNSINPLMDVGQCEGGFVFGTGYFIQEEVLIQKDGSNASIDTWDYKIPTAYDTPTDFRVELLKDSVYPKSMI
eukprot:TRINITY_DN4438_c0_g2_i2.p1 TRINITY_DN4438_c0_g2~~TRINITY_DN4438_c0_g2_i2.p1  ORF type:complete len:1236 (+),score=297.56 TRINITY_DN4438_c0_g2_i2:108-3815(+)